MYLKNCWYVAAWDYELIDGKLLARTLLNENVLLYRGDSGEVIALNNRCPHRGALLSEGRREGDGVRCMYHGIKYDQGGRCVQIPGQDMIPPKLRTRKYPIVESARLIWIWMGDPARADRTLIPEYAPLHDPQWRGLPAYLHYDANYLLIVDNLSDFSHLAFVHTNTLGGSEEYAYVTKPVVVEKQPRGFRVERWHMNSEAPPFHKKVIRDKDRTGRPPQSCDHADSRHLLHGNDVHACRSGRRKWQHPERTRIPQLPIHDAGNRPQHALLLGVPE